MLNLINEKVSHKSLGEGTIVEVEDEVIAKIYNNEAEKPVSLPEDLITQGELLQDYNSYCFLKSESAFLASLTCPLLIASSASANFFSIS